MSELRSRIESLVDALPASLRPISRSAWRLRSIGLGLALTQVSLFLLAQQSPLFIVLVGVQMAGAGVYLSGRRRRQLEADEELARASMELEAEGLWREAAEACERGASLARDIPNTHASLVFYAGWYRLMRGEPEAGLARMCSVVRSGWLDAWTPMVRYEMHSALAFGWVAAGDVESAKSEVELAARCGYEPRLISAIISLREERWTDAWRALEAVDAMDDRWLTPSHFRTLSMLRGFAVSRLDRDMRTDEEVRAYVRGAKPYRNGAYTYLAVNWPELREYLETEGLDE